MTPRLPVQAARRGVLHTWPAYRASLDDIVLDLTWPHALRALGAAAVRTRLIEGTDDQVADPVVMSAAAGLGPTIATQWVDGAGHELPLTHPILCRAALVDNGAS